MRKIVVLHVFTDDKFFDGVSDFFDSLYCVENLYHYYTSVIGYNFKYIKKKNKIKLFHDYSDYCHYFSDSVVDVIYFHSLSPKFYSLFKYIGLKQKVIWWSWGYELYQPFGLCQALVKIDLYKTLTRKYLQKKIRYRLYSLISTFYFSFKYPYFLLNRKNVINRIDYFSPVLSIEYELFKYYCPYFKAKPFMLEGGPLNFSEFKFNNRTTYGNILIGNSLSYTNNHLDVFDTLRRCKFSESQKIIVPVNYGGVFGENHSYLKRNLKEIDDSVIWLDKFIPFDEYFALFKSMSHAIFGVIRQQAMGNIFECLANGIMVFLFKESVVYKDLKKQGYKIYTIEEDLCDNILQMPLSKEDAYVNYKLVYSSRKDRRNIAEKELEKIFDNKNES